MSTKTKTILAIALVLAMCAFIFAMSAKVADDSDQLSLGVVAQIIALVVPGYETMNAAEQAFYQGSLNHIVRKCAHFSEYALLGVLALNASIQIIRNRRKLAPRDLSLRLAPLATISWALATLYAATDEFHQLFVPGRGCQFTDVCIDSTGVLTGIMIALAVVTLVKKRRERAAKE